MRVEPVLASASPAGRTRVDIFDGGGRYQDFACRGPLCAVHTRDELLRDDRPKGISKLNADLVLLVGRKDVYDAIDGIHRALQDGETKLGISFRALMCFHWPAGLDLYFEAGVHGLPGYEIPNRRRE